MWSFDDEDEFCSKVCDIFSVDSDSSLFDSENNYDSDATCCSQAEEMLAKERAKVKISKLSSTFENSAPSQNIASGGASNKFEDIGNEAEGIKELWAALIRCDQGPTVDVFMPCFKKFQASTLIRLSLQLKEFLENEKESSIKRQKEMDWYKNYTMSDEEKEDSLRRLSEIAQQYKQ